MPTPLRLSETRPFLRFVRKLTLNPFSTYPEVASSDARFFFCLEGEGHITAGGSSFAMKKGSLLLIPAGVPYHLRPPSASITYLAVNFDYTSEAME